MKITRWIPPALCLIAANHHAAATQRPPNFIVIQCDDLGWDDLGLHGNPHAHTPHLDALGSSSMRFAEFTVNPVCAPSRATFLTGKHFLRTGVSHVHGGKDYLACGERTLADHLRAAGYRTGMWGKWHLGTGEGYDPWQRGFDEAYSAELYRHRESRGLMNGKPVEHAKWADEVIADHVIDFMERHRGEPFFAYVPTLTPHSPHDAPERWVKRFTEAGHSEALARIRAMVSFLDEQVGRIMGAVERLGIAEHTVVIFMSDNGPAIDLNKLNDAERKLRKPGVFRGWKGDLYESAVRSPLFVHWPGVIKPQDVATPVNLADLLPTLLDLAGARLPDHLPPIDGRSFRDLLFGGDFETRPVFDYAHRGWLTSGPPYSLDGIPGEYMPIPADAKSALAFDAQSLSMRKGNYKWLRNPEFDPPRTMLVDLVKDPGETTDVSAAHPDVARRMDAALREWWDGILSEPASFGSPVFGLKAGENIIPARAPSTVAGHVFNTVIELKNWRESGDEARYRIRTEKGGNATISLRWNPGPPADTRWIIVAGKSEGVTDGTAAVDLPIPAGESELILRLTSDVPVSDVPVASLRAFLIDLKP